MKQVTLHTIIITAFCLAASMPLNAQYTHAPAKDRLAIKAMAGCFDVEFKYTETFAPEVDYEKAYDYTSAALELALIVEETEDMVVLQHLLIINDSTIIKHWRQDWIYEHPTYWTYDRAMKNGHRWTKKTHTKNDVNGKWTQLVYQVDDSPRYGGTATWTHVDGVSRWFNRADAPLPRREYSKRSDYNLMKRGNAVLITEEGWLHEQDNDKIIRSDEKDELLVQEKGYNTYKRVSADKCQLATDWWVKNKAKWATIRDAWNHVYDNTNEIYMIDKIDNKRLYEHLFKNDISWTTSSVKDQIEAYIKPRS